MSNAPNGTSNATATTTASSGKKPANVINVKLSDKGKELVTMAAGLSDMNLSRFQRMALVEATRKTLREFDLLDDAAEEELSRGMKEPKDSSDE